MKVAYKTIRFTAKSRHLITQANEIINEYARSGLSLTLRQLYYQFVARGLLENKMANYKMMGNVISNGRLTGLIDWDAIEDRTRNLKDRSHWNNPGQILHSAANSYHLDYWEGQKYQVEIWIEKEALVGVIADICYDLDVPYFACKGYVSQSEMWNAAKRLERWSKLGRQPIIIHLGDHDPSGIDMTRDITDRHYLFDNWNLNVERIALNMDQIIKYDPPPNPAKEKDSRSKEYIAQHGYSSWELDALDPKIMQNLIKTKVQTYRNQNVYDEVVKAEKAHKKLLLNVAENWEKL